MPEKNSELFSIVMPLFNEGSGIGAVIPQISEQLKQAGVAFEFVLVDDGSRDNTWQTVSDLAEITPGIRAARLSRNFGKEAALAAGLAMAGGDVVIVMDADGQHPPSLIPKMIEIYRDSGVEIVEGIKANRGNETLFSKLSAGMFYFLWNTLSGFDLRGASDFKLMSRRAVNAYLELDERGLFFRGMTAWLGFRREQIPFEVAERSGGRSGWTVFRLISLALTGITSFSAVPLQFVSLVGFLFFIFAILFGIQTLYVYLSGQAVTGFATVILLLLIIGSFLMISLGIIGIYLARIYDEIKGRPRFLISEQIGSAGSRTPNLIRGVIDSDD